MYFILKIRKDYKMKEKYFKTLDYFLKNEEEIQNYSQYKIMKKFNVAQSTAKKVKERIQMKVKEAKFLKKVSGEIEIQDPKMIPIVMYLLKDNNFFKTTQDVMNETGFSRYLVKNAREIIEDFVKENMK